MSSAIATSSGQSVSGKRVIMFCFGGRRGNLELQLPFIHRILDEHPHIEYHLWNLARDRDDYAWINTLHQSHTDRLHVWDDGYSEKPWERFTDVYLTYANPKYQAFDFVKLDDDVVFIESNTFGDFLRAIASTPQGVVSAKVVNNGACTPTWPKLWEEFRRGTTKLLDVHKSKEYAELSHGYFFDHWKSMVGEETFLIPTEDWLSINLIGYNWQMGQKIYNLLGIPSPRMIAGRPYRPSIHRVGDEGAVNMLPRTIVQGFTAAHLYFGPQAKAMPQGQVDGLRKQYAEIGAKYLAL